MTRNQHLPKYAKDLSGGAMFMVDGDGNITPTAQQGQQTVYRDGTIVTQPDNSGNKTFGGRVCAQQGDECQCSTLVEDATSDSHMTIGTGYRVKSSVALGSMFEIYAVTGSGEQVPSASNGEIVIGTT